MKQTTQTKRMATVALFASSLLDKGARARAQAKTTIAIGLKQELS